MYRIFSSFHSVFGNGYRVKLMIIIYNYLPSANNLILSYVSSILLIFQLDFGIVPTVWYSMFCFFIWLYDGEVIFKWWWSNQCHRSSITTIKLVNIEIYAIRQLVQSNIFRTCTCTDTIENAVASTGNLTVIYDRADKMTDSDIRQAFNQWITAKSNVTEHQQIMIT